MPRIMAIGGLSDCGCGSSRTKPLRAGSSEGGVGAVVLEGRPRGTRGLGRSGRVCVEVKGKVRCFKSQRAAERALGKKHRRRNRRRG